MKSSSQLADFLQRLADFAIAFQRKIAWLVLLGALASLYFAWLAYSSEAALWWNLVKCSVILSPALVWVFIWSMLGQLSEAPALAASLASEPDTLMENIDSIRNQDNIGVAGLIKSVRALKEDDSLGVVLDTIGNVTLIANPLFALFAAIMLAVLLIMMIVLLFVLLF